MPQNKPPPPAAKVSTKARVLAAAERLLRTGNAEFSMRDLAAEAGLSFATPFNQFGGKVAIMRALSANRIAMMRARLAATSLPTKTSHRVLSAVKIAVEVMLGEPEINKAVMAVLGAPSNPPGNASIQSAELWAASIGKGEGLDPSMISTALKVLPEQLAFGFRGVLSFWTAGELADADLLERAQAAAAVVLLGFVDSEDRAKLERRLVRHAQLCGFAKLLKMP
jgi:AcrR family transcriptional regulator